jgi:transposase InsO family protein
MDFFTVDTMLGKRFYVFAIISHKTREIVRFAITENPTREFVRQQLMLLSETIASGVYLIHDNALMFNMDFLAYNLVSIKTGVEAPNMNSIMERFFRTVRREALDNFLLTGKSQVRRSWMSISLSTTASDHIRGFSKEFRGLVKQKEWLVPSARAPF